MLHFLQLLSFELSDYLGHASLWILITLMSRDQLSKPLHTDKLYHSFHPGSKNYQPRSLSGLQTNLKLLPTGSAFSHSPSTQDPLGLQEISWAPLERKAHSNHTSSLLLIACHLYQHALRSCSPNDFPNTHSDSDMHSLEHTFSQLLAPIYLFFTNIRELILLISELFVKRNLLVKICEWKLTTNVDWI